MDLEQQRCWLSLAQQPYAHIANFLKQVSSIDDAEVTALIMPWLKSNRCKINKHYLEQALSWLLHPGYSLVNYTQLPENLKTIKDPPALLFLDGDSKLLYLPKLAIVGSRKPGHSGRENALYFANHLSSAGLTIISGLANGIDGLAHQSALKSGGYTIAVLGCGHKTCYPANHRALFNEISKKGLLISEFPPDTGVRAHQFPRRNRIISGLSLGVLVIEAAVGSVASSYSGSNKSHFLSLLFCQGIEQLSGSF